MWGWKVCILMPIWPLFFWIKRWIVKMCPKCTRYLLFLSELQIFLWRLWKRKEYNLLLRAREGTWKPWCFDELSQNVNFFERAFPSLFYKAPKFVLKLPTFWKKTPTFFWKISHVFWKISHVFCGASWRNRYICREYFHSTVYVHPNTMSTDDVSQVFPLVFIQHSCRTLDDAPIV